MSFKKNVTANYASQIYVTLAGIAIVPLYLKYMGAEAYGLIGFFAMLQAWFALLDIGFSPTLARETARSRAGATPAIDFRRLVRALTMIFVAVALLGSALILFSTSYIVDKWLQVDALPRKEVYLAVQLMALGIGLRWLSGLARARIIGAESIVWLSSFNAVLATIRFGGAIPVFILVNTRADTFFAFQLIVAAIELAILSSKANSLLPTLESTKTVGWSLAPIKGVLKFSLTVAFTSSLWVFVTQTDKLVLSKLLPLQNYGYFSLAVVISGSVLLATGPIAMALIPRMTNLLAKNDEAEMLLIYRRATRLVSVIAFPVAFILAAFSEPIVWAWTGDAKAAKEIAPILQLYALGNAVMSVCAFPAYLQFAHGQLRLHMIGSALFVLVLLPALVFGVLAYGPIGAGWVWLGTNILYLAVWVPVVHRRFAPKIHLRWLGRDVIPAAVIATCCVLLATPWIGDLSVNRIEAGLVPIVVGLLVLLASSIPLIWQEMSLSKKIGARA